MTQARRDGACVIHCPERDLAHEIAFLTVLSRVGEHLDAVGLHRVHALGLQAQGAAALVLLPMGGGKTTLTLRLLREEGVRLLSEDSPLIARRGEVLPFPLRIGVRPGEEPPGTPPDLHADRGANGVRAEDPHRHRALPGPARRALPAGRHPAGRAVAGRAVGHRARAAGAARWTPCCRHCVVGLGLYQGIEFVLERSGWEIAGKAGLALRRLRSSLALIRRSRVYRFRIGPDREECAQVLAEFLRGEG